MSSTIIDSPDAESIASAAPDVEAHPHLPVHRAWLVAVALVAVVTLGLTVAWQTATGAAVPGTPGASSPAAPAVPRVPAESVEAGLLALAWDLTPTSQRQAACAQFTADPGAAWTSYSTAAQDVTTRAEFAAFFSAAC
jgi:hypothetical protein